MAGGHTPREHLEQQGSVVERLGLRETLAKTTNRNATLAAAVQAEYERTQRLAQQRRDAQRQYAEDLRAREQRRAQQQRQQLQPGQQGQRPPWQQPLHVWVKGHPGVTGRRAGLLIARRLDPVRGWLAYVALVTDGPEGPALLVTWIRFRHLRRAGS